MPLRNRDTLAAFAAGLLDPGASQPASLLQPAHSPLATGYAVHRNGVATGLIGALQSIYPTTARLIGADNFKAVAQRHAKAYPPASPVLHEYGADFPAHLAEMEELAQLPFLPDVARVERAWLDSWHAADALPLRGDTLCALSQDRLMEARFHPHPATRLLSLGSSAGSIVAMDRRGEDIAGFDPLPAEHLLLTRPDLAVFTTVLTEATAAFLQALLSGKTLGDAALAGLTADPQLTLADAIALTITAGALRDDLPSA